MSVLPPLNILAAYRGIDPYGQEANRNALAAGLMPQPQTQPQGGGWDRDMVLPFARQTDQRGNVLRGGGMFGSDWHFAAPQFVADMGNAAVAMRDNVFGGRPTTTNDMIAHAGAVVGPMMAGGYVMPKPRNVLGSGGGRVTMYHGTTPEGFSGINSSGKIDGPAFFSNRRSNAEDYGQHIVEVDVPTNVLKIDADMPGAYLMSVDEANGYFNNKGWTIDDYIRANRYSFGVDGDVPIR